MESNPKVLLMFGEIDCRMHVIKERDAGGFTYEIVRVCVNRYLEAIGLIKSAGFDVAIWGIHPLLCSWRLCIQRVEHMRYGHPWEVLDAEYMFNCILEEQCDIHGIKFASIFEKMIEREMHYDRDNYIADCCHLSQRCLEIALEALKEGNII